MIPEDQALLPGARRHEGLVNYPPPDRWDHFVEMDARAHPRKVPHEYMLIPTTCFTCESGCGLLAFVDKKDLSVKKLEGNPAHPGSRGCNCAKGPAVVGMSHHMGRWKPRDHDGNAGNSWVGGEVDIQHADGVWRIHQTTSVGPFVSDDLDSSRIYWDDAGVHQNLTFPVQPDPISGMHCWLQKVRIEPAHPNDRYGDIVVDTTKSHQVYQEWRTMTRPAPGPGGLRRPEFMHRPVKPKRHAFRMGE